MASSQTEKVIVREIRSVAGLLDVEGSPLVEPRIHPDAAESIWAEALREKKAAGFAIEFRVPSGEEFRAGEVQTAVRCHFERRRIELEEELRNLFQDGWRSLGIGLLVVAALLAIAEAIPYFGSGRAVMALSESLIILAWVALWHPGDLLLYAHFPVRHHLRLAKVLAQAEVTLRVKSAD